MNSIQVIEDFEPNKDKNEITSKPLEVKPIQTTSGEINDISSRLMTSKIIRINPLSSDCCKGCNQISLAINVISRIDDENPTNENETPLFRVEENTSCCRSCTNCFKFHFYAHDSNNESVLYVSEIKDKAKIIYSCCCCISYIELPDILNYKANDSKTQSIINRHDSRAIYRTYEYLGQAYFKIGKPYEEKENNCCCYYCCWCCFSKDDDTQEKNGCCCSKVDDTQANLCCCSKVDDTQEKKGCCESYIERSYIHIFNMSDQLEGKFAYCIEKNKPFGKSFFEIYFPPEANELIRISLISQCIFLFKTSSFQREMFFAFLPGTKPELIKFYS